LLGCVRAHWAIENSFHWVLDAVFKKDNNRTQERNSVRNLASLRRIALNLLKQRKGKASLWQMRYQDALNEDFLFDVLRS
jgi:predicted transposase YbfD/YdcC